MWWIAGSLVMGTGIWSMHFVGMLALSLPMDIGFTPLLTFVSWLAAVGASVIALGVASGGRYSRRSIALASLAMGAGICAMHYIGMAALDLQPGIVWDWRLVAASAVIAVAASAAALLIFRLLQRVHARQRFALQVLAATLMGAAISGMHYTGHGRGRLSGRFGLPERRRAGRAKPGRRGRRSRPWCCCWARCWRPSWKPGCSGSARLLSQSLQESNARLQSANDELLQRALSDPLTGLPNRKLFEDRLRQAVRRLRARQPEGAWSSSWP